MSTINLEEYFKDMLKEGNEIKLEKFVEDVINSKDNLKLRETLVSTPKKISYEEGTKLLNITCEQDVMQLCTTDYYKNIILGEYLRLSKIYTSEQMTFNVIVSPGKKYIDLTAEYFRLGMSNKRLPNVVTNLFNLDLSGVSHFIYYTEESICSDTTTANILVGDLADLYRCVALDSLKNEYVNVIKTNYEWAEKHNNFLEKLKIEKVDFNVDLISTLKCDSTPESDFNGQCISELERNNFSDYVNSEDTIDYIEALDYSKVEYELYKTTKQLEDGVKIKHTKTRDCLSIDKLEVTDIFNKKQLGYIPDEISVLADKCKEDCIKLKTGLKTIEGDFNGED